MSDSPSLFAMTTLRTAALIPESGLCPTETHAIASPSAIRPTTDFTADQIHEMGLKSVAQIEQEMLKIAKSQSFSDLKSFNAHIRQDPALHAKSGQQLLDLYTKYRDQMYGKLPELFGRLPKTSSMSCPWKNSAAPTAYPPITPSAAATVPAPDGSTSTNTRPRSACCLMWKPLPITKASLAIICNFPSRRNSPICRPFRRFTLDVNAYTEGWAFYSERLGKEAGFYQDPYSEYGRLQNEMWRAVRWVVDTGVHSKHWTRQQMIDYFHEHTAMDDQNIGTEVDRYIAWPGQALSYKMGQMKILELRERAQKELGPKFGLRAFHDAVLDQGPLPLDVLETKITEWIKQQK